MKYIFPFLIAAFLFSCDTSSKKETNEDELANEVVVDESAERNVMILFDQKQFSDPKKAELLKELKICNPTQKDYENMVEPACDPRFFEIMPFAENEPIENAFLLVIRAGVHQWPLRRVLVYQREAGKLVLVNSFVANLVGMQKSGTKHDDLILQFLDEYENRLECVYKWKENRYQYASVLRIEGNKIKAGLQDSMNVEIAKVIADNKMAS